MIHREAEAAFGQRRQRLVLDRAEAAIGAWVNSNIMAPASALLASMKSRNCLKALASVSVDALMLQNRPTSRLLSCRRRVTCTQPEYQKVVDLRHQADGFGKVDEFAGRDDVAFFGAQARHCFVVAHLALRQRDDRLQIKVDAVGVGGPPDQIADAFTAHALEAHAATRRRRRFRSAPAARRPMTLSLRQARALACARA